MLNIFHLSLISSIVLAQTLTGEWTTTNVAILLYVAGQIVVMIIRAWRGDPQSSAAQTALAQQIQNILATQGSHGTQLLDLAKHAIPPETAERLIAAFEQTKPLIQQLNQRRLTAQAAGQTSAQV